MLRVHEESLCTFNVFNGSDEDLKDLVHGRLLTPGRYEADPLTDCLIFCGAWTERGVGRVRVGQRVYNVARVAAWLYKGMDLFSSRWAYHRCNSSACFAEEHVGIAPSRSIAFALRRAENLESPVRPPVVPPGRVTAATAQTIERLAAQGWTVKAMARNLHLTEYEVLTVFMEAPPARFKIRGRHDKESPRAAARRAA
jgi:hypothetical protein